ncbi:MAG: recombinase RecT [Candidatus Improbicoccus devescovinae]|nr:MAG: recombinase RecT [Candidatus Improbicoccus devescovinae]
MENQTTMSIYLSNEKTKNYLKSILGERTGQFITSLTSLASSSNSLKNCDRNSLLACALTATSMELPFDPNLGFAWAVPYKTTVTFQIGCKGYTQLALRTGQYRALNARDVREGEFKGRNFVGDPIIEWLPDDERTEKPIVGYMAGLELVNGFKKLVFWTVSEVEKYAEKYSQSYRKFKKTGNGGDAIWALQFDKMAEKTVLKSLISKYGIMSIEMQNAVKSDHSKLKIDFDTGEEVAEYIDNPSISNNLSGEEQKKLLEKFGSEKVTKTLEKFGLQSLNEVQKEDLEIFRREAESC